MTNLRKGQVRLGPRTWAIIREAYLNGASGESLAQTYGCSLGTIRYRARAEGWRRCDAHGEGAAAPAGPAVDPRAEAATPRELLDLAIDAAGRALRAYVRVAEALRARAPQILKRFEEKFGLSPGGPEPPRLLHETSSSPASSGGVAGA